MEPELLIVTFQFWFSLATLIHLWFVVRVLEKLTMGVQILRQPLTTLEKPSPLGSLNGFQLFMRCRYSSVTRDGSGLFVPSDRGGGVILDQVWSILPALELLRREHSRGNSFQWIIILNCIFCRYKEEEKRFRVPLALPIIMCVIYLYLVVMPIINKPSWYFLVAILFGLGGLIFYIPFAYLSDKCQWFDRITIFFQLLLRLGVADKDL